MPFPGIDNSMGHRGAPLTIRHTKYYQWVAFTLFFQVSIYIFFVQRIKKLHIQFSKTTKKKLVGKCVDNYRKLIFKLLYDT